MRKFNDYSLPIESKSVSWAFDMPCGLTLVSCLVLAHSAPRTHRTVPRIIALVNTFSTCDSYPPSPHLCLHLVKILPVL